MRISIWQQFSSNNSSSFTVVGVFDTPEAAEQAANEVRHMIETVKTWWDANPDAWDRYTWADETPTPPEAEIGERFGFTWPGAVEWYHNASIEVVLDRFIYLTTTGFRPDTAGEPFDKVFTGLGGQGLLDGNFYGDQIGTILAQVTCTAPDEETARSILQRHLSWEKFGVVEGSYLNLYDWTFSEFDLPKLIEELKEKNCLDIRYRLYQSENPNGKMPAAKDFDVLIQVLDKATYSDDIDHVADALAEIGDVRAVEPLIRALNPVDSPYRIISALGDLQDKRAVTVLIEMLKTRGTLSPAHVAARALGKIGDASAVKPLLDFMAEHDAWQVGAEALANIGEPARVAIEDAIRSTNSVLAERGLYALSLLNDTQRFGEIFLALHTNDPEAQRRTFENVKVAPQAVDILIAILRNPPAAWMRSEAAKTLGEMGAANAVGTISEFLLYLGGTGITALEKIGGPAVESLMKLVEGQTQEKWLRDSAVWALGRIGDPRSADMLLNVLKGTEWDRLTQKGATQGLAQLGDVRAIPPLLDLFVTFAERWHPDHDAWVIKALRQLGGLSLLADRLLDDIHSDPESPSVTRDILALAVIGDERAVKPLVDLLPNATPSVQRAIEYTLDKLKDSRE